MTKRTRTRRWNCPICGRGRLAPSRPRRDDVRRYCLPCSEATGRLVERVCPANERERERSEERARAKATRRRAAARKTRERADERARRRKSGLDPYERFLGRALGLRAWEVDLATRPPKVTWSRSSDGRASGRANGTRISIRLGTAVAGNLELILHELAHVAFDRRDLRVEGEPRWHNSVFRGLLARAVAEVTGDRLEPSDRTVDVDAAATEALALWLESPDCWFRGESAATRPRPTARRPSGSTLDRLVEGDSRLLRWWSEGADGYWVELVPGFAVDGVHDVHEWRVRDVVEAVRRIEPCDCGECRSTKS